MAQVETVFVHKDIIEEPETRAQYIRAGIPEKMFHTLYIGVDETGTKVAIWPYNKRLSIQQNLKKGSVLLSFDCVTAILRIMKALMTGKSMKEYREAHERYWQNKAPHKCFSELDNADALPNLWNDIWGPAGPGRAVFTSASDVYYTVFLRVEPAEEKMSNHQIFLALQSALPGWAEREEASMDPSYNNEDDNGDTDDEDEERDVVYHDGDSVMGPPLPKRVKIEETEESEGDNNEDAAAAAAAAAAGYNVFNPRPPVIEDTEDSEGDNNEIAAAADYSAFNARPPTIEDTEDSEGDSNGAAAAPVAPAVAAAAAVASVATGLAARAAAARAIAAVAAAPSPALSVAADGADGGFGDLAPHNPEDDIEIDNVEDVEDIEDENNNNKGASDAPPADDADADVDDNVDNLLYFGLVAAQKELGDKMTTLTESMKAIGEQLAAFTNKNKKKRSRAEADM